MDFRYGLEHELAFLTEQGAFVDHEHVRFADLSRVVEDLPKFAADDSQLRLGDAGIKVKRWYIEGYERFDEAGRLTDCPPKGIEIRTTIHDSVAAALCELSRSYVLLRRAAGRYGYAPLPISYHPFGRSFTPDPPLNDYERRRREASPEKRTAAIPMLTFGPDLNLSACGVSGNHSIDLGRKLTYYSPFLVPFSFSAPFYGGERWQGYSARTYFRTGPRPAVLVFLENPSDLIDSSPALTKPARLPAEIGRIEFKAFDTCSDFLLYGSFLSALKGLMLDRSLSGRATVPDAGLHQLAAAEGFDSPVIERGARAVLQAAEAALPEAEDRQRLQALWRMLEERYTPAQSLIDIYEEAATLEAALWNIADRHSLRSHRSI